MIIGIDVGSILVKAIVIDESSEDSIVFKTVTKSAGDPEVITPVSYTHLTLPTN